MRATDGKLKAIELPDTLQPTVAYGAAVVKGAEHEDAAKAFVDGLLDGDGKAALDDGRLRAAAGPVRPFPLVLAGSLAISLLFLTLPVAAIFLDTSPAELWRSLGEEGALDALRLSLVCSTTSLALVVLFGTPSAWLLATRRFRGRALVITLVELPLVLPPAVAGIGLLAALGPQGVFGGAIGDRLVLTTAGVVCALTFVSAPFYMRQAQASFEALDQTWLDASRTLGATEARTFARIAIPAAGPGLLAGRRARLGPRAGRVRRHADVRGLLPRDHADGAAGDLRALRHRLHERARALGGARRASRRRCCCRSSCSAARDGSAVLRVEARATLGALALDVALTVDAGRCLALAGPVGSGQDLDPARGGRAAAAGARRRRVRRGGLARHRARDRRRARSGAAAATSSRSTRCSATCARGRTSPTR